MPIKRVRPTIARQRELEAEVKKLEEKLAAGGATEVPRGAIEAMEAMEADLKDAQALTGEAQTRVSELEEQLRDALEGKDHTQGADLPPVPVGRQRFFVDLKPIHAEYLRRAAAREQRDPGNMIERIIRIDCSRDPGKAGLIQLGTGTSMPAGDAPQIPVTR